MDRQWLAPEPRAIRVYAGGVMSGQRNGVFLTAFFQIIDTFVEIHYIGAVIPGGGHHLN
jgi:hypothetical protein